MKKKVSQRTAPKRKNEFRYHNVAVQKDNGKIKSQSHPSYIWQERGNMYDYHSITHSEHVNGVALKKLRCNPNPNDSRDSYYDINSKADLKSRFGKKRKKWKMHPLDREEIHNK